MRFSAVLAVLISIPSAHAEITNRVSVSTAGEEANGASRSPSLSADGRYVAFSSEASNLIPVDNTSFEDIFVRDRLLGLTFRVSGGPGRSAEANAPSRNPAMSPDGRYVAFSSLASNLVAGDTNGLEDVFVHDILTRETTRVSLGDGGMQALGGESEFPSISHAGRFVAFSSKAHNLVPGDTNDDHDVFVHDRTTGRTERVSVTSLGEQVSGYNPSISGDGRYVAFGSRSPDVVPDDTNDAADVFVHDRETGETKRVSVSSTGDELRGCGVLSFSFGFGGAEISRNGRYVAFVTVKCNSRYVKDLQTGELTVVSVDSSGRGELDFDDGHIDVDDAGGAIYASEYPLLAAADTNQERDVFKHDPLVGTTERISVNSLGTQSVGPASFGVSSSADGLWAAFSSEAPDLTLSGDGNGVEDVFVRGPILPKEPCSVDLEAVFHPSIDVVDVTAEVQTSSALSLVRIWVGTDDASPGGENREIQLVYSALQPKLDPPQTVFRSVPVTRPGASVAVAVYVRIDQLTKPKLLCTDYWQEFFGPLLEDPLQSLRFSLERAAQSETQP